MLRRALFAENINQKKTKRLQMKKSTNTYIAMVIDRSGSMSSIRDDTIGGINTFLDEQRKNPEGVRVTYAQFDNQYEIVYDNVELSFVPKITRETFQPRAMTALLDAIGKTINHVSSFLALSSTPPTKVIMVIVTDGHENVSRSFTRSAIHEMITDKQNNHDWQFVFLAANQDAIATANTFGVRAGSAMNYSAGAVGVANVFTAASVQASNYTRGLSDGVEFTAYERACSTGDSLSAQDAALAQYAKATGQTLAEVKRQAASGQGGATVVSSTQSGESGS